MDTPSSACSTITFSARKILIVGYYHFLKLFYTMKQVLKGTRKRMMKGLVVTFTLLILMMVSLITNNNNKQFNNSKFNSNVRTLDTIIRFFI